MADKKTLTSNLNGTNVDYSITAKDPLLNGLRSDRESDTTVQDRTIIELTDRLKEVNLVFSEYLEDEVEEKPQADLRPSFLEYQENVLEAYQKLRVAPPKNVKRFASRNRHIDGPLPDSYRHKPKPKLSLSDKTPFSFDNSLFSFGDQALQPLKLIPAPIPHTPLFSSEFKPDLKNINEQITKKSQSNTEIPSSTFSFSFGPVNVNVEKFPDGRVQGYSDIGPSSKDAVIMPPYPYSSNPPKMNFSFGNPAFTNSSEPDPLFKSKAPPFKFTGTNPSHSGSLREVSSLSNLEKGKLFDVKQNVAFGSTSRDSFPTRLKMSSTMFPPEVSKTPIAFGTFTGSNGSTLSISKFGDNPQGSQSNKVTHISKKQAGSFPEASKRFMGSRNNSTPEEINSTLSPSKIFSRPSDKPPLFGNPENIPSQLKETTKNFNNGVPQLFGSRPTSFFGPLTQESTQPSESEEVQETGKKHRLSTWTESCTLDDIDD